MDSYKLKLRVKGAKFPPARMDGSSPHSAPKKFESTDERLEETNLEPLSKKARCWHWVECLRLSEECHHCPLSELSHFSTYPWLKQCAEVQLHTYKWISWCVFAGISYASYFTQHWKIWLCIQEWITWSCTARLVKFILSSSQFMNHWILG